MYHLNHFIARRQQQNFELHDQMWVDSGTRSHFFLGRKRNKEPCCRSVSTFSNIRVVGIKIAQMAFWNKSFQNNWKKKNCPSYFMTFFVLNFFKENLFGYKILSRHCICIWCWKIPKLPIKQKLGVIFGGSFVAFVLRALFVGFGRTAAGNGRRTLVEARL